MNNKKRKYDKLGIDYGKGSFVVIKAIK